MKKALAVSLAILMLLSTFPAVNIFAVYDEPIVVTEEEKEKGKEELSFNVPDGYSFSFDRTDENGKAYYCYESQPSEYGLINVLWFDENGNTVNDPFTPFAPQGDGSIVADGNIPSVYDARESGLITSVKNQRQTGTCWAHAATSCMETSLIKQGYADNSIDLNEFYMVRYAQDGYISGETGSKNDGAQFIPSESYPTFLDFGGNYVVVKSVAKSFTSPVLNEKYPFDNDGSSTVPFSQELITKLTFGERFDYDYILDNCYLVDEDIAEIKAAILEYGSVQASYHSSTQYYTTGTSGSYHYMGDIPCAFYCPDDKPTNHAVTIVGWDDDFSADNFRTDCKPQRNGAWLIKNSWGEAFGNNGYFWISYEDKTIDTFVVYTADLKNDYENVYFYDGYYSESANYISASNASANVFVAKGNEYVTKVYNNTASDSTKYSIYKLNEGYTSPVDGELLYSYNGPTDKNDKYINVYGDVYLEEGNIFSVVFETGNARCEGRNRTDGIMNYIFTANSNESFYRDTSGNWHDAAENNYSNVVVRAVTTTAREADSYKVTFSHPGKKDIVVWSDGNTVELPSMSGYTYTFTANGEPFDGTNVTHDMYVEMHLYSTNGIVREDEPCTTYYNCEYCNKEILPHVTAHNYVPTVTEPTESAFGFTTHTCSVCKTAYVSDYTTIAQFSGIKDQWRWMIYGGKLYIEGEGALPNYTEASPSPWAEYKDSITEVYIGEGITKLGDYTFYRHSKLKEAHYPSTLYYLGRYCFGYCTSLEVGVIPCTDTHTSDNHTNFPFFECTGMEKLILSEGITYVFYSFYFTSYSTTNLKEIVLPSTLDTINAYAFQCTCGVEKITLSPENKHFKVVDGVLYTKDGKELMLYPSGDSRVYFKVPSTVEKIDEYAFNFLTGLKYLDLSESNVTTLGRNSIKNTSSLTNVNLPSGLTTINDNAIAVRPKFKNMYIPDTVTAISSNAFDKSNGNPVICTNSSGSAAAAYCAANSFSCTTDHTSHNFSTVAYTKSATCNPGFTVKTCVCGQFKVEEIASTGSHTWVETERVAASCSAEGSVSYRCSVCNETKTETLTKLDHSFTNYTYNNDAKCEVNGTETAKCENCDATDTREATGTALSHSFTNYVSDNNATCTADGTKTATCNNGCGKTDTIADTGSKLGHSFTNYTYNNDAKCEVNGTETAKCENCDATDTREATGTALSHSFTNYVSDNNATCTADGTKTATCNNGCGKTDTVADTGSKLSHSYTGAVKDNDNGTHSYKCVNGCNQYGGTVDCTYGEWGVETPATCTSDGSQKRTCSACGYEETKTVTKLGHKYGTFTYDGATAKTHTKVCENDASHKVTENCSFTSAVTKKATCKEAGVKTYTCSTCGGTYTEEITKLSHSFINYTYNNDAKCEVNGTETAKCENCDATDTREATGTALSHSFTNYVSDNNATCTADGTKTATCNNGCGKTDTIADTGSKLGHSFTNYVSDNNATCTADGTKTATCNNGCGKTDTVADTGSKLSHSYTGAVKDNDNGTHSYKCVNGCNQYGGTVDCTYGEWTVVTPATCTNDGSKVKKCIYCGDVKSTEKITAKGHSEYISKQAVEPTCTKNGNTVEKKCSVCETVTVSSKSISAYGHSDGNGDGLCDRCGVSIAAASCSCNCHKSGFMGFIWTIQRFFYKLFGINRTCACGVKHY